MIYDNRANILAQALELFASRGYDAVGVQEIATAAGVAKPTLYHYFGSKVGLLETLLASKFDLLTACVRSAAEYHGDLPFTLTSVARAYFTFARQYPTFYRLQLSMYFAPPESDPAKVIRQFNEVLYKLIEDIFILATKDHGNMRDRHQRYAVTFHGMIDTYIGLFLNGYIRLNDEVLYQAVHQFMHGIYS
jgi:TetR/AcrR family transcriptional regulator